MSAPLESGPCNQHARVFNAADSLCTSRCTWSHAQHDGTALTSESPYLFLPSLCVPAIRRTSDDPCFRRHGVLGVYMRSSRDAPVHEARAGELRRPETIHYEFLSIKNMFAILMCRTARWLIHALPKPTTYANRYIVTIIQTVLPNAGICPTKSIL